MPLPNKVQIPPAIILIGMGVWLLPAGKPRAKRSLRDWLTGIDFGGAASLLVSVSYIVLSPRTLRISTFSDVDRSILAISLSVIEHRLNPAPPNDGDSPRDRRPCLPLIRLHRTAHRPTSHFAPLPIEATQQSLYRVDCRLGGYRKLQHGLPPSNALRDHVSTAGIPRRRTSLTEFGESF